MKQEKLDELMKQAVENSDIAALVELIAYLIKLDKDIEKKLEELKSMAKGAPAPKAKTTYIS